MTQPAPDTLATKLAEAAMTIMVRTCRKEAASASDAQLEAALAAMRARTKPVLDRLLDDARAAPWIAEAALCAAALDLAQVGIASLRGH